MSADTKMTGDDAPNPSEAETREEEMLNHHVAMLDRYARTELQHALSTSQDHRCRVLRQQAAELELLISRQGKEESANRYLQNAPQSVNHNDFLAWLQERGPRIAPPLPPLKSMHLPQRSNTQSSSFFSTVLSEEIPPPNTPLFKDITALPGIQSARLTLPCLRCKILKRKCDPLEKCSHCPEQSDEHESDYWKVLGCLRSLSELCSIFLPDYTRTPTRIYKSKLGSTLRLLHDFKQPTQYTGDGLPESVAAASDTKGLLQDADWDDLTLRHARSLEAKDSLHLAEKHIVDPRSPNPSLTHVLPGKLLYVGINHDAYKKSTRYNLFTLLRLGRSLVPFSSAAAVYNPAEQLLASAVDLYLDEGSNLQMVKAAIFNPYGDSLRKERLVSSNLAEELHNFMESFEKACSGRGKLLGNQQFACLYSLLLFSVVKSLLIDSCSLAAEMRADAPWTESTAVRINSSYKALVSLFSWSSKTDVVMEPFVALDCQSVDLALEEAFNKTQKMLRTSEWAQQNIKGTREFLLNLGTSQPDESSFNGFFIQRVGLAQCSLKGVHPGRTSDDGLFETVRPPQFNAINASSIIPSTNPQGRQEEAKPMRIQRQYEIAPLIKPLSQSSTWSSTNSDSSSVALTSIDQIFPTRSTTQIGWEHTTVLPNDSGFGELQVVPENRVNKRRRQKFSPETARKVRQVRKQGACMRCRIQKIPCSTEGEACQACQKVSIGSLQYSVCLRTGFNDFSSILFPDFLYSHLKKDRVQELVSASIESFNHTTINAKVTFDGTCSLDLESHRFLPANNTLLESLTRTVRGEVQNIESLPIGMMGMNMTEVKPQVNMYLGDVLASQEKNDTFTTENNSPLPHQVLAILYKANSSPTGSTNLLCQALRFYIPQLLLDQLVIVEEPSAIDIIQNLNPSETSPTPAARSSRLLERQIKHVMHTLAGQLIIKILESLEKSLRTRSKDAWIDIVSSILVLCLCIEQTQILAVTAMHAGADAGDQSRAKAESIAACTEVEDYSFRAILDIFHMVYKSARVEVKAGDGYNPLKQCVRSGVDPSALSDLGLDRSTEIVVRDLGKSVVNSYAELVSLDRKPNFEEGAEDFARNNRGRLVAKFLLSLVDEKSVRNRLAAAGDDATTAMKVE